MNYQKLLPVLSAHYANQLSATHTPSTDGAENPSVDTVESIPLSPVARSATEVALTTRRTIHEGNLLIRELDNAIGNPIYLVNR